MPIENPNAILIKITVCDIYNFSNYPEIFSSKNKKTIIYMILYEKYSKILFYFHDLSSPKINLPDLVYKTSNYQHKPKIYISQPVFE